MRTVVVAGALANKPFNGGNAWTRLSWACGFRRLGFRVLFVEQIARAACVDAAGRPAAFADSANLAYFRGVMAGFGLSGDAALVCEDGGRVEGVEGAGYEQLRAAAESADLLFNISGHLSLPPLKGPPRRKVYFDDDPGFTQFWHAAGSAGPRLEGHAFYYTVGRNIGAPGCPIPTGGIPWRHTSPPVVLEHWPAAPPQPSTAAEPFTFTTIASWRGPYGPVEYGGRTYGVKAHEFRKFVDVPRRAAAATGGRTRFEVALDIHPGDAKDLRALHDAGWHTVDPRAAASDPQAFRDYVRNSAAEFSAAQGVYVDTDSGWFSDRTVRYLASGRPALVQETGFSRHYPAGEGLVPFRTLDEAVNGAARIAGDYDRHCRAARAIAEEYFDSDKVLGRLLEEVGVSA